MSIGDLKMSFMTALAIVDVIRVETVAGSAGDKVWQMGKSRLAGF
jgi:hypothetical protein